LLTNRQLFLRHQAQTSPTPLLLEIARAEGCWMYGPDGERYLDLISGIAVSNVGHRHPRVLAAIHEQLDKYLHLMVYGELVQAPQVQLATALAATVPEHLGCAYLVNSGSEAVEAALKLAKRLTGRAELVSAIDSYHGATHGALSVTGNEGFRRAFRPLLPGVRQIRYNYFDDLRFITHATAAVLLEVVQGEAGVREPAPGYLAAVRARCTEVGALLIFDEIQTGFGRTGTFWGCEQEGVWPDALVCAKGMGGGMPIGALLSSRENLAAFTSDPVLGHITTFGGHPVSCAAALATLRIIQDENLLAGIPAKSALLRKELASIPGVRAVRGRGLLLAAEMADYPTLKAVIDRALLGGVLTDWFLFCDNSLRAAPPLTISEDEIRFAGSVLRESSLSD
jgi:acetylornithine/succinyldiaminopimelate/putrescine aminotransferase